MHSVLDARTEIGKRALGYSASSAWNLLQNGLELNLNVFKSGMKGIKQILCFFFQLAWLHRRPKHYFLFLT